MDEIKESRTEDESFLGKVSIQNTCNPPRQSLSQPKSMLAQMQLDLVSRNFAETMKKIFHRVQRLIMRHQDRPRMVRLSGDFVQMDRGPGTPILMSR